MSQLNSHLNERMTKARLDSWLSSKLSSFCSHGEKIKAEKFKFPSRTKTWVSCQTKNRPHLRSFIEKLKEQKHSKQDGCFEHKHCWLRTAITNFHSVTTDSVNLLRHIWCSPFLQPIHFRRMNWLRRVENTWFARNRPHGTKNRTQDSR